MFSRAQSETEVFKVLKSGKTKRKGWKRMVTKVTFVDDNFTRKPPKFERFIRPMGLRMKKAHVTHPELKATFCVPIIGVKKNPSSPMYTNLGVITKVRRSILSGLVSRSVCAGNCAGGQYQRAGAGDQRREGGVGEVRPGHQQPGE